MTRSYRTLTVCPQCGCKHSAEDAFSEWVRVHPLLHSVRDGIVAFDCDLLIHRYKNLTDKIGSREVQAMMLVEAKQMMAEPENSQIDTLRKLSQILRNRRQTPTSKKEGRHAKDHVPPCVVDGTHGPCRLFLFGAHLLQMSGTTPIDSDILLWDRKPITVGQLVGLLRFDLEPDPRRFLQPVDWVRRHHAEREEPERPLLRDLL